jgi:hypothetical protein
LQTTTNDNLFTTVVKIPQAHDQSNINR